MLLAPLLRPEGGETFSDGHEIARSKQRVTAHVLEHVLFLAGVGMNQLRAPEERLDRIHPALRTHHPVALLEPDVVDEDLAKALGGVDDVDRASPILLR